MYSMDRLKQLCPVTPLAFIVPLKESRTKETVFFGLLFAASQPLESDDRRDIIPIDPGSRRHL